MAAEFELCKDNAGEYRWRLQAENTGLNSLERWLRRFR